MVNRFYNFYLFNVKYLQGKLLRSFNYFKWVVSRRFIRWEADDVVLYGLQRSGTNIIRTALREHGITIINNLTLPHCSKWNTHFRFRADSIPTKSLAGYFVQPELYNDTEYYGAKLIDENLKYLLVIRDFDEWIISILKWGMINGWFSNAKGAQNLVNALVVDYIRYCETWLEIVQTKKIKLTIIPFHLLDWETEFAARTNYKIRKGKYDNTRVQGSYRFDRLKNETPQIIANVDVNEDLRARAKKLYAQLKLL